MAWSRGDLITASKLNSENAAFNQTIKLNGNGWNTEEGYFYFYSTLQEGEDMIIPSGGFGWNSNCGLLLGRLENGSWVEKEQRGGTSGWWNWNYDKGNFPSYGEGLYILTYSLTNHQSNFQFVFNTSKTDNVRGNLLRMIGNSEVLSTQSSDMARVSGETITYEALNEGRVFTD